MTPEEGGKLVYEAGRKPGDGSWPWEDIQPGARERCIRIWEAVDRASREDIAITIRRMRDAELDALPGEALTRAMAAGLKMALDVVEDPNG